ncbi:hypothetical protein Purlil1_9155 [Purpureocillium lilacinum]|uniref:NmrA-like domain-containing protein n=1 Tax=Purpureocillium lilacinum TaxID=33203 RepID=A0ABR0BRG5_PURLI|nr:hypothetical protein Purlil1_9155 [Purpureocillium lilacinum]
MKSIAIFPASGALGTSTYTHLIAQLPPPPPSSASASSASASPRVTLISRFPEKVPREFLSTGEVDEAAEGGGAGAGDGEGREGGRGGRGPLVRTLAASYESPPETLRAAFAGHDVLFLISYPSHAHALRTRLQLPVVDAARAAGVRHVFYSSLAFAGNSPSSASSLSSAAAGHDQTSSGGGEGVGATTLAEVMRAHLDTEAYLARLAREDPSFTYTVVREGLYSESYPIYTAFFDVQRHARMYAGGGVGGGGGGDGDGDGTAVPRHEILIPHDGSGPGISWVKRDELGEATARLIAWYAAAAAAASGQAQRPFPYVNKTVTLTGPRVYSLAETARVLSRAAARGGFSSSPSKDKDDGDAYVDEDSVRIREVSVDEYVAQPQVKAAFGGDEVLARSWATAWDAIRAGETALVDGTLREVLGREPEAFEVTIRDIVAAR